MVSTLVFFAIMAAVWNKFRAKDRTGGKGAFSDPDRVLDDASGIVAFLLLAVLSYVAVFAPGIVFSAGIFPVPVLLWAIVSMTAFAAAFQFTRKMGKIEMGGLNGILNGIAWKVKSALRSASDVGRR